MELDRTLKIRLSSSQLSAWKAVAARERVPLSTLVRAALLGRAIHRVPEINQQAWIQLSHAASNLNQLALRLNSAASIGDDMLFKTARDNAAHVVRALDDFRAALLGAHLEDERA